MARGTSFASTGDDVMKHPHARRRFVVEWLGRILVGASVLAVLSFGLGVFLTRDGDWAMQGLLGSGLIALIITIIGLIGIRREDAEAKRRQP